MPGSDSGVRTDLRMSASRRISESDCHQNSPRPAAATDGARGNPPAATLLVFARYPQPGRCKTRLIPALGAERAAELYGEMVRRTLWQCDELRRLSADPVRIVIEYDGASREDMASFVGADRELAAQSSGDLGERLAHAARMAFDAGAQRLAIIGTDCPALTADILQKALEALERCDLVLGPASDGGYYLIGLSRFHAELFESMPWSTDRLLAQTLKTAERIGLTVELLPVLDDVDLPEDLSVWEQHRHQQSCGTTVVIPTFNLEPRLEAAIASARQAAGVEVIVVAAGDVTESREAASRMGCRFLESPAERGRQLNAGARVALGENLLFLHADTELPSGWDAEVRRVLSIKRTIGGAFPVRLDAPGWRLRLIERGIAIRSRWLQWPYGDQALFLKREVFRLQGGFPELPLMEDFAFVRRLKSTGTIRLADIPVITSARRWLRLGAWRVTLINQLMVGGFLLGVPMRYLVRLYNRRAGL